VQVGDKQHPHISKLEAKTEDQKIKRYGHEFRGFWAKDVSPAKTHPDAAGAIQESAKGSVGLNQFSIKEMVLPL
jgi:hypothetical protein